LSKKGLQSKCHASNTVGEGKIVQVHLLYMTSMSFPHQKCPAKPCLTISRENLTLTSLRFVLKYSISFAEKYSFETFSRLLPSWGLILWAMPMLEIPDTVALGPQWKRMYLM